MPERGHLTKLETLTCALLALYGVALAWSWVSFVIYAKAHFSPELAAAVFSPPLVNVMTILVLTMAILRNWRGWRTYAGMVAWLLLISSISRLARISAEVATSSASSTSVLSLPNGLLAAGAILACSILAITWRVPPPHMERGLAGPFAHMFGFGGRIARIDYWLARLFLLPLWAMGASAAFNLTAIVTKGSGAQALNSPFYVASVAFFVCVAGLMVIATSAKRWHDLDRSGWWQLIQFVPLGGIYELVMCGFARGTKGRNRFGEDPLSDPQASPADAADRLRAQGPKYRLIDESPGASPDLPPLDVAAFSDSTPLPKLGERSGKGYDALIKNLAILCSAAIANHPRDTAVLANNSGYAVLKDNSELSDLLCRHYERGGALAMRAIFDEVTTSAETMLEVVQPLLEANQVLPIGTRGRKTLQEIGERARSGGDPVGQMAIVKHALMLGQWHHQNSPDTSVEVRRQIWRWVEGDGTRETA